MLQLRSKTRWAPDSSKNFYQAKLVNGEAHYVLLGQGEVPIFSAIDVLRNGGYKGYYSFEWEKLWHPELLGPEIALADYPKAMRKHFE